MTLGTPPIRSRATAWMTAMAAVTAPVGYGTYHDIAPQNLITIQDGHCYVHPELAGKSFCEDPPLVSSAPGVRLTWLNRSSFPHTITRCTASACQGLDGGDGADVFGDRERVFQTGNSYAFTFHGAGTYRYYCRIHGYAAMHGAVIVSSAGSSEAAGAQGSTGSGSGGSTGYGVSGSDASGTIGISGPLSGTGTGSHVAQGSTQSIAANVSHGGSGATMFRWLVPLIVAASLAGVAGLRARRRHI